jgi:hypothetical protein
MSLQRTLLAATLLIAADSCRWQSSNPTTTPTGEFGEGTGFTAQCSGDFPDWISSNPPAPDASGDVNPSEPGTQKAFQMAQAYPLGTPVFVTDSGGNSVLDHWNPPAPNTDAPWRTITNLSTVANRNSYLAAIKDYILMGMSNPGIDFDAVKNNATSGRKWFHVPMMTASGALRREPYHGVTAERQLRPSEQTHWLTAGSNLKAVAVGYYNWLGGYTIGQVFPHYDLTKTDASKGKFIDGTLVFKLLFAEYVPSRINGPDPLLNSPAWWVQDPSSPSSPLTQMRLLQVDIAVKDDHFTGTTGWVFATYVYDESLLATEPNAWRRLTPIGIQWGNDPAVTTATGIAALNETWINPSIPAAFAFADHHGRAGRLIGPVDNPVSSCLSCHSTAEVDMSKVGMANAFMGAAVIPPGACSNAMAWFRNVPSSTAFGSALSCPATTSPSTVGLTSQDYSLQLQRGLQSVFGYQNPNPCSDSAKQHHDEAGDSEATLVTRAMKAAPRERALERNIMEGRMVKMKPENRWVGPTPEEPNQR